MTGSCVIAIAHSEIQSSHNKSFVVEIYLYFDSLLREMKVQEDIHYTENVPELYQFKLEYRNKEVALMMKRDERTIRQGETKASGAAQQPRADGNYSVQQMPSCVIWNWMSVLAWLNSQWHVFKDLLCLELRQWLRDKFVLWLACICILVCGGEHNFERVT